MPPEIGDRVARLRVKRGLSQDDLAAKAGIHRVTVANIERGAKRPALDTLEQLARALRVKLTDLLR